MGPGALSTSLLSRYDTVLLGPAELAPTAASDLCGWVEHGGGLVAIRPSRSLCYLFGIEPTGSTQPGGYVVVDTSETPGAGVSDRALQVHAPADHHRLTSARAVAMLLDDRRATTGAPAVTVRPVGSRGGRATAVTYDLAASVVQTRQGNLEWAGQNRDGDLLTRSNDLFHGAATHDPQPDWIDRDLLDVPQADEQQRLLVQLLQHASATGRPIPRFWYLPRGLRVAVVMTGDDHAFNGTAERFRAYADLDRAGGHGRGLDRGPQRPRTSTLTAR